MKVGWKEERRNREGGREVLDFYEEGENEGRRKIDGCIGRGEGPSQGGKIGKERWWKLKERGL